MFLLFVEEKDIILFTFFFEAEAGIRAPLVTGVQTCALPIFGTTRRGVVDRSTTTLMYAGWDRRSAIRRKVPLTRNAAGQAGAHNTFGDRSCDGGAPARRDDQRTSPADPEQMRWQVRRLMRSSRPTGSQPTRGRWRPPPRSWRSCGRPGGGTGRTGAAALPTPARSPAGPGPAGGRRSGCRPLAGAGRTRPTRPAGRAGGRCRPW